MTQPMTPERFRERQDVERRVESFDALAAVTAVELEVPPPVEEVIVKERGKAPKLSAEAFELARQVYYLQQGSLADAARAIIASELSDTSDVTKVRERLQNWWRRERWPKRPHAAMVTIRDANHDGGLYRGRLCKGETTGRAAAPAGTPCRQTALDDSDYCPQHDPRPEYVERRRQLALRFRDRRLADQVPLEPFQRWCDTERKRLLEAARSSGRRIHPNNEGWGLLAEKLGIDISQLTRYALGYRKRGKLVTEIRAKTVVRYLSKAGVTFRDVYGFDPPTVERGVGKTCPECGGSKNSGSKTCRRCWEASLGEPCPYVNRAREVCGVPTRHESGLCAAHRRIVERVPRSRTGRASFVTAPMLILATEEYVEGISSLSWVASAMWDVNAAGVCDVFTRRSSLASALVKQFRKRGWRTVDDVSRANAELVAEHGSVPWPRERGDAPPEAAALIPFEPFLRWLRERHGELGSFAALSRRIRMNPDNLSRWIRGPERKATVRRATVDAALEQWGDGVVFADLYGGGA